MATETSELQTKQVYPLMAQDVSIEYAEKPEGYFEGARADFVGRLPENLNGRILEIGCSSGGTGALALQQKKCAEYVGVELMEEAAASARNKLTEVIVADLETDTLPFQPDSFDALIASEIFEHLRNPWAVLESLMPYLKPGAVILASSPNIAHKSVIKGLVKGKFDYEDFGVMDRTHLRWFTPTTYTALFADAGLKVVDCWPVTPPSRKHRMIAKFLPNGEQTYWRQICVEARKMP